MSPALRSWLLDCPTLASVSTLALDAAACGLIDLDDAVARAVSVDVRLQAMGLAEQYNGPRFRHLAGPPWRKPRLRIRIAAGSAVLKGTFAPGAAVAQCGGEAILHLATTLPETVATALTGRLLRTLISAPLLDIRDHVISQARCMRFGVEVRFPVASRPIAAIRP